MNHVGSEAVVDLHGRFLRAGGIFARNIARLLAVCHLIEMDDAVCHVVVADDFELRPLLKKPPQLHRLRVEAQVLWRAHKNARLAHHVVRVIGQIFLRYVAVFERIEIGKIIRHPVFFARVLRRDGHRAAAHGGPGGLQIIVQIAYARTVGAEISLLIAAGFLRLRGILLRLFPTAGNDADEQNQRHQRQNRKQNQPGVLPEELSLLLLPVTPGLTRFRFPVLLPVLFGVRLHTLPCLPV